MITHRSGHCEVSLLIAAILDGHDDIVVKLLQRQGGNHSIRQVDTNFVVCDPEVPTTHPRSVTVNALQAACHVSNPRLLKILMALHSHSNLFVKTWYNEKQKLDFCGIAARVWTEQMLQEEKLHFFPFLRIIVHWMDDVSEWRKEKLRQIMIAFTDKHVPIDFVKKALLGETIESSFSWTDVPFRYYKYVLDNADTPQKKQLFRKLYILGWTPETHMFHHFWKKRIVFLHKIVYRLDAMWVQNNNSGLRLPLELWQHIFAFVIRLK